MMATNSGKPIIKPVLAKLTPDMTREQKVKNLISVLRRSGIKVELGASKSSQGGSA